MGADRCIMMITVPDILYPGLHWVTGNCKIERMQTAANRHGPAALVKTVKHTPKEQLMGNAFCMQVCR